MIRKKFILKDFLIIKIRKKIIPKDFIIKKIPNGRKLISAELIAFSVALEKISILNSVLPREQVWVVKVSGDSDTLFQKIPIQTLVYDAETGELLAWEGSFESFSQPNSINTVNLK